MRKSIFFAFLAICSFFSHSFAQSHGARIMILNGGDVNFFFNSLDKYDNGITYSNWTLLAIHYGDTTAANTNWQLQIKANSSILLPSNAPDPDLPLSVIQIWVQDGGGATPLAAYNQAPIGSPVALSDSDQQLISNAPQGTTNDNRLYLSYKCDVSGLGFSPLPNFYYVDLVLTLSPQP